MTTRARLDLGMSILAVLFLVAYAWPILQPELPRAAAAVCQSVIALTWIAFAVEYVVRLASARRRGRWFVRHLLDLLVLVLPLLRPLRLLRALIAVQRMARLGSTTLRGRVGVYVGGGACLVVVLAALAVLDVERGRPGASIESFGDALWWALTTMTTVGYGDTYPVTTAGRWVAVGLMLGGVALLGTVTATIASWLVGAVSEEVRSASEINDDSLLLEIQELRRQVATLTDAVEAGPRSPNP